jgi:dihydroorotase
MLLLKNGYVMDPKSKTEEKMDVLVAEGRILQMEKQIKEESISDKTLEIIDVAGKIVAPGLVDVHAHFRDPGYTYKADLLTESRAAKKGGYTTVILMANTKPVGDSKEVINYINNNAVDLPVHIKTCATVTMHMEGEILTDMDMLKANGAVGFTDDGRPILSEEVLEKAMRKTAELGVPISLHEEDPKYIKNNGINDAIANAYFYLEGATNKAEYSMIKRDLEIALKTNAILNIQHVSTKESVDYIREARKISKRIYAEATPHHFSMTEEDVRTKGTLAKMNPPLRTEVDRKAIVQGLKENVISIIATDHAPHTMEEKEEDFFRAPSGIIGLETALSLGIKYLVETGELTLMEVLEKMTCNPAELYQLDAGELRVGGPADMVVFSEKETEMYTHCASKSKNTPFLGEILPGVVYLTIVDGNIVYRKE